MRPLTEKQKLLPLPGRHAVDVLLVAHLALVACRTGYGNRHLLFELVHATYLSYFMWSAGYGTADQALYSVAERTLDDAARKGYASDVWSIDIEAAQTLAPVLAVYEQQVETVPLRDLAAAKARLRSQFQDKRRCQKVGKFH